MWSKINYRCFMGLIKKKTSAPEKIEISEQHIKVRTIAFILLLVIGIGSLTYFLCKLFIKEPGWITIEIDDPEIKNEFILNYNIGQGDRSAADEYKSIASMYSREAMKAYRLFDIYREYSDVINLYHINNSPNEILEIDPILYRAFELMQKHGGRIHYLAPIHSTYRDLFSSQNEIEARLSDPNYNDEIHEYFEQVLSYTNNADMIDLKLLGDNKIMLHVSDEYMSFAEENGIEEYIDLSIYTNAFIVDHVADVMNSYGYILGNITSFDGYTRNLDTTGTRYSYNIFDRIDNDLYTAATLTYENATSFVLMRNYPMSAQDSMSYFGYSNGNYACKYVDPETGYYKSSVDDMIAYSGELGCAEIALKMSKVFIADSLDLNVINDLLGSYIYSIWADDNKIYYNDEKAELADIYKDDEISYESVPVK